VFDFPVVVVSMKTKDCRSGGDNGGVEQVEEAGYDKYAWKGDRRGPHGPLLPEGGYSYFRVLFVKVGDHAEDPAALKAATRMKYFVFGASRVN